MEQKPGNDSSVVIDLQHISKVYQVEAQQVNALVDVSLQVKRGQIIAVTGRSGSGKSTLLHIAGMLDQPTQGRLSINGTDVSRMPDNLASQFRNATVGFVFQMNNLLPEFSAVENVMMPGLIAGLQFNEVQARAQGLLDAVMLGQRARHRPGELSGGEQQRVAIARALLMQPPIILADEPTGNLDKRNSDAVQELLFRLCTDHGVSMLLVTHDMNLAAQFPTQIVMEDGRIVERGGQW